MAVLLAAAVRALVGSAALAPSRRAAGPAAGAARVSGAGAKRGEVSAAAVGHARGAQCLLGGNLTQCENKYVD